MSEPIYLASSDVASLFGVGNSTVSNWKVRDDTFPAPKFKLAKSIDVYDQDEVVKWWAGKHHNLLDALKRLEHEEIN